MALRLIVVDDCCLQLLWNPEPQTPSKLLTQHLNLFLIQLWIQQLGLQQIQFLLQALLHHRLLRPLVPLQNPLMQLLAKAPVELQLQLLIFLWEPLMEFPVRFLLEHLTELQSHVEPQMDLIIKNRPEFPENLPPELQTELQETQPAKLRCQSWR